MIIKLHCNKRNALILREIARGIRKRCQNLTNTNFVQFSIFAGDGLLLLLLLMVWKRT